MAHSVEPMDLDSIDSEFDNKENSFHHNNVLQCTEKGYEELDVSELDMKLRYSITPAPSPMSKSCVENRTLDLTPNSDDSLNCLANEGNTLTRSYNSTLVKNENVNKVKSLPLQSLPKDQFIDGNRNASVVLQLNKTVTTGNTTITISGNEDESISLPSSSSSTLQTPEATSPVKDFPKDGGSPIMRGLKSVLNMFRPSTSPIPPAESECNTLQSPEISPANINVPKESSDSHKIAVSTPILGHRNKEGGSKRSSPLKESIIFNEEIEKELLWKDETTIFFNHEKIPKHKLFLLHGKSTSDMPKDFDNSLNSTVEYMDISCNDTLIDRTVTEVSDAKNDCVESDGEFVDCETTFTKNVSPEKDAVNQQDTIVSNNVTMKHLVKQASKVMLNITVPATDENLIVNNFLGESDLHDKFKPGTSGSPLNLTTGDIETYQEQSINIISNNASLKESTKDNLNASIAVTDVSLDSIEINAVQIPQTAVNAVTNKTLEFSQSPMVEKSNEIIDPVKIVNYLESHILPNSNLDSLATNYELDSLEPNLKTDIIGTVKVNEQNKSTIPDLPRPRLFPLESIIDTATDSMKLDSVKDVPADIPLPDDDEFEKSLTSALKESNTHNLNNDTVGCSTFPPICINEEGIVTSNDTNNLEINTTLDLVTAMNFNQSDLSQILKDIDSIINSDSSTTVNDKQESQVAPLSETEDKLKIQDQNVTMDIESTIGPEILPDILHHTGTSNLEKLETLLNDESVSSHVVEKHQVIECDVKSEVLEDQLLIDKTINVVAGYNDVHTNSTLKDSQTNILLNDTAPHIIVEKETKGTISEGFHPTDVLSKLVDEPINKPVFAEKENSEELFDKSVLNENEDGKNKTHNKKSDKDIQEFKNTSDTCVANSIIINTSDINTETDVDDRRYKMELVNSDNKNEFAKTEKQHVSCEKIDSEIINNLQLDLKNLNNTFDVKEPDTPMIFASLDSKIDVNVLQASDEIIFRSVKNEMNINLTQETKVEETLQVINNPESISRDLNITSTEYGCNAYTRVISSCNNEDVIVINQESDIGVNKEPCLNEDKPSTIQQAIQNNSYNIDEEIILSENNSPYVSVADNLNIISQSMPEENVEELRYCVKETSISDDCQPSSPAIVSKGYNFNFDEIDDPFTSKTKIRQSPPLDTICKHNQSLEEKPTSEKEMNKNKRMSQTERKRLVNKRKFNSSFNNSGKTKERTRNEKDITDYTVAHKVTQHNSNTQIDASRLHDKNNSVERDPNVKDVDKKNDVEQEDIKTSVDVFVDDSNNSIDPTKDNNKTSSSEHATDISQETSCNENVKSRNVFNLPEIDDINFNPFATKTKMRQSPPPVRNVDNPFATISKFTNSPNASIIGTETNNFIELSESKTPVDKMDTELMEKQSLSNTSIATCSSKATDDKDTTVREVHTEDEDTEEGPFFEADEEDKMSNFGDDNDDMMQFPDFPPREQENTETGELFIDAQAFEFLLNQNTPNVVADSGKESLFLKFDPLFAKRISSDGVFAALSKIQKRQSTPRKLSKTKSDNTSVQPSPSQATQTSSNTAYEFEGKAMLEGSTEEQNVTISKPMMVVTPAVNPVPLPRKSMTPTRTNRRSLTFTSPAMAVIDRLLSMSAHNSLLGEEAVTQISQEQHEADLALTQLRELLAEKEIHVYNLRLESKDLRERLSTMETQIKSLETESQERLRKINELNEKLAEKSKMNKSMAAVVEEYERTIASLIAETEQDKKRHAEERIKLINERDEQIAHLASMEVSFNDLHMKYEKSKQVILTYKANEDKCKKSLKEYEENFTKMQNNYELLKQHATSKLNHANQELEKINRTHEAEVLKLNAMMKRKELHITSLEETLSQKTKANEELTAICEELINKVG